MQDQAAIQSEEEKKRTKKDYERLKNLSLKAILTKASSEKPRVQKFEDDSLDNLVKIEKKKGVKAKSKREQMERDLEI